MIRSIRNIIITAALLASAMTATAQATGETMFLSGSHAMVRTNNAARYMLLPVEEKAEMCNLRVLADGEAVKTLNVRMAVDHIDYYVPLDLSPYKDKHVVLDIHSNGNNSCNWRPLATERLSKKPSLKNAALALNPSLIGIFTGMVSSICPITSLTSAFILSLIHI